MKVTDHYTLAYCGADYIGQHRTIALFKLDSKGNRSEQISPAFPYPIYSEQIQHYQGNTDRRWEKTIAYFLSLTKEEWEAVLMLSAVEG